MSLSTILETFITNADEPDADALGNAIRRLANESARCVANQTCGEVAAIAQRCGTALICIDAEQRDPDSRVNRHGRQRAVLDLIDLAEAIRQFHAGKGDDDAFAAMRAEVSAALRPIVEAADD